MGLREELGCHQEGDTGCGGRGRGRVWGGQDTSGTPGDSLPVAVLGNFRLSQIEGGGFHPEPLFATICLNSATGNVTETSGTLKCLPGALHNVVPSLPW